MLQTNSSTSLMQSMKSPDQKWQVFAVQLACMFTLGFFGEYERVSIREGELETWDSSKCLIDYSLPICYDFWDGE